MIGTYVSRVCRVIDGDTIVVDVDEWPPIIGHNISIRLRGINCPELSSKNPQIHSAAKMAKGFTMTKIARADKIYLNNIGRGCYFRIIADVWLDGKDLGTMLFGEGLAVRACR